MTRTILASATALLAATTLFGSAAQACLSCEYVPEVVRGHQTSDAARPYAAVRVYTAQTEHTSRPAKKRIVSETVDKNLNTAAAAPITPEAKTENSSITGAETAKADAANENSSISLASTDAAGTEKPAAAKAEQEAAAKPVDCKKFFASVGMTLTVPCD
jgi:hypothetical protein